MSRIALVPITVLCILTTPVLIQGLDENTGKEVKCDTFPLPKDVGLDLKWFGSIPKFYVPLWSQLQATRTAADILEKDISNVTTSDMETPSCLVMNSDTTVAGWGRVIKYAMGGDANALTYKAPRPGAKSGVFHYYLTDNKSYVLGIACWEDNELGWAVLSTKQTLEGDIKTTIMEYVKSVGFKEEAIAENYGGCGISN